MSTDAPTFSSPQTRTWLARVLLTVLLASLLIAALIGIAAMVRGDFFGDTEGKALSSVLVLALFSGTAWAAALRLDRKKYMWIGFLGLAVSMVAAALSFFVIWGEVNPFGPNEEAFDWVFRPWLIASISAVFLAHASLFILIRPRHRPVAFLIGGTLASATLAWALLVVLTWLSMGGGGGETMWRTFGVFAVLALLGTLGAPILNRVLDSR